ncbi:hypothetical protein JI752_016845 [Lysobacter sp. MMG2]|uniref:hypothetical protein n=1 Tax=Lysobacter sp. MMG2 TaxID=2801338 RepID=UPI001C213E7C|nr:hypothetical protein [Lysobacter sp. MMG2]MBU8977817.1 hypothetical protein [Lysobacter sp. MMG2]
MRAQRAKVDPAWPNALRWFLSQSLASFAPWHFITQGEELSFAAREFRLQDVAGREVLVFARREDAEEFAGLEIVGARVTGRVIRFSPGFVAGTDAAARHDIVKDAYEDVFGFVADRVIPDMRAAAARHDAATL